ncbi:uncharacterized protein PHACADRAFT_253450 [Phanerochaete carnosa HHB-10118-sp]|uniref:SET domain-containing protein n=1 Tax=Phanerochaete carnosa (strain HHB-10118-sp) TaxID=650164 RepID=K5VXT2_PHACS|nr:uncharacterized protein PHACADRAFT_253450 [Phanerochaete carnosa HHB-10118-sp]EKM56373.1 hypothetical protein PHACADRAFT_253450 [Phanerochaete carnosa HHB-10118-sp]
MQYRCYEVHSQRLEYHRRARDRLLFKERSEPASSYIPHAHSKDASSNGVNNHNVLKHFEPCSHAGPCGGAAGGCTCRDSDSHCERSCCCTADCPRRFSGCDCARLQLKMRKQPHPEECYEPEPDLCISHECPCVKNGRECDPELCDCLHYTCSDEDVECKNADLRRERGKQLRVGPSVFGLGVFLEEHVQRGELICEYVGELTYDATTETRGLLAQHRGRAYVFKLNNTFDVDASYAGNIARFINHAPSRRANCTTIIMNVSSDQRIGLYAKKSMVSGTELTIDYGDDFFTTETKASSVSSRTTEKSRSSTESASTR